MFSHFQSRGPSLNVHSTPCQRQQWDTVRRYLADEMKAKLNAPLNCSHSRSKSKCTKGECMSSALKHQRIRSARSD